MGKANKNRKYGRHAKHLKLLARKVANKLQRGDTRKARRRAERLASLKEAA